MITSLLLALREGLEAALIIGIVLGALKKTGRSNLNQSLWLGAISAFLLSILVAFLLRLIGTELEGTAEQIYEGSTLLLAAGVLTWMIFWMFRQSRNLKVELENSVNQVTSFGSKSGLFFLAFIAVLREGIELVLYLTAVSLTTDGGQTLIGTSIGLLAAAALGYLLYTATIHLNLQRFFQLTGILLILFAAGLIAQGVAEFNEAGVIPAIISPIWNLNPYLDDHSTLGMILNTLFGYHGSPSLSMVLGYSVYILAIGFLYKKGKRARAN
jgi:high-affinity iron transporter